jgi:hypothetical protein
VNVAVLEELIYAMGGFNGRDRQETAERYDYRTNQWSLIAPMNERRSDASATTLNGKLNAEQQMVIFRAHLSTHLHVSPLKQVQKWK